MEQHAVRMVERGHSVISYNRSGHNVFGKGYDKKKNKEYKGIKIITVPTISGSFCVPIYSFFATLHAIFTRPDVVSYRASGSCVMIPLAKLFGLRCVASLHGIDSQRDKWGKFASKYLEFGERMAATKADACLVLSKNMKKYIKNTYGVNSIIFANGIVKPEIFKPDIIKKKYGLKKNKYLLSLGRIVPEKGLHYLIEAFKKCNTDMELVIAGGSEANSDYYNHLVQMSRDDKRIKFIGFVEGKTIAELYSNAYLFMLPSNLEGMANALLEAMSYGNCCIVSNIPENTEVVEDKAIIFKKGNVSDLKKKIMYAIENPKEVEKIKKESSKFIVNKYDWEKIVTQMLEIYNGNLINYCDVDKLNKN